MIGTLPVVIYYIEKEGITNLHITGEAGTPFFANQGGQLEIQGKNRLRFLTVL